MQKRYDCTAGYIVTPAGLGKYVDFDSVTGKVTVEIDSMYLVEFDGEKCFLLQDDILNVGTKKDAL